jgi:hypothetical protein
MNLAPPAGSPASQRPYQVGRALGSKAGKPVQVTVEWLIDTGADIGVVRKAIGDRFDLTPTAASASPTTGGGGIIVKSGLRVEFRAEDHHGVSHTLLVSRSLGVKSNNNGSDIVGMDQLASAGVTVSWDPGGRTGALQVKPPTTSAAAAPSGSASLPRPGPSPAIVDHGSWLDVGGVRIDKRLWRAPGRRAD